MHLGDGVIGSVPLLAGSAALGGCALYAALRRSVLHNSQLVAWAGTLGAFVLVAQAINVPLLPGVSVHLIGASLLALSLGTPSAIVTLSAVLVIQALLLGDGGITTLGINLVTLAVLPVLAVNAMRQIWPGHSLWQLSASTWLGTVLGHVLTAILLASTLVLGAGAPARLTFGWLVAVHGLAGVVEGGLTAALIWQLRSRAPALTWCRVGSRLGGELGPSHVSSGLDQPARSVQGLGWPALAVVLALFLLPLASTQPDALQQLLQRLQLP